MTKLEVLNELNPHLAATLRVGGRAGASLVRHLVTAARVLAVLHEAVVLALRSLCDSRVECDDAVRGGAASAAPGNQLVALKAALLLTALVALELVERDEHVLAWRLAGRRATVDAALARAAVRAANSLARHCAAAVELVRAGALPSIVHLLDSGGAESAAAVAALEAIVMAPEHRLPIVSARGVAFLLRALGGESNRSVQEPACAALRMLCLSCGACRQVAASGELQTLVVLLSRGDAQLREAAAGLLGTIALDPQGRSRALATSSVAALVKLLPLRHEATQEAAARALPQPRVGRRRSGAGASGLSPYFRGRTGRH